ncbi:Holliday junction branch migration protein RuvA [bacterium]|nr:MAG: Holliday junction branch migration protein RuvA [bacterium]
MIAHIQGIVAEKTPMRVVIDVSGIGYELLIPISSYDKIGAIGETTKLLTYQHVREDVLQLFGFSTKEEREMFLLLISISGIGPKSALGIISSIAVKELKHAIAHENLTLLTAVPGIGKKTAQRIVVELKDKVAKMGVTVDAASKFAASGSSQTADEAMMALISLGYHKSVSEKAIVRALQENPDNPMSLQELIKAALRYASA